MPDSDLAIIHGLFAEARGFEGTDRPAWLALQVPVIWPRLSRATQAVVLGGVG